MFEWITRYRSERMIKIWQDEEKYRIWKDIETAVLEGWAKLGIVPPKVVEEVRDVEVKPEEVRQEELKTRHEVTGFIRVIEKKVSEEARKYIHLGITSADVMDTATTIQLIRSCDYLIEAIQEVERVLRNLAERYKYVVSVGRTHGVHAEPITLGLRFLSHYAEFRRVRRLFVFARENMRFGKISGAVGVYNTVPPEVEEHVLSKFDLKPEPIPTQVIPRDRYAVFVFACSLLASAIERIALNIRISQMTEIGEIVESFEEHQTGSSVMPHKKNPVLSENLTGIARAIRSALIPALESIPLLMERDISNSSVERIIFPQICMLSDFALKRLKILLEGMRVDEERVRKNIELSGGMILSSRALFELVVGGYDREKAYRLVQRASFSVIEGKYRNFKEALVALLEKEDKRLSQIISEKLEIEKPKYVDYIFERVLSMPVEIKVTKKEDVFDPEGKTIAERLRKIGIGVKDVRVGKFYVVKPENEIDSDMIEFFVNPVVEEYRLYLEE